MIAMDAERLQNDTALQDFIDSMRTDALGSAIYDPDHATREQGRSLVMAVDLFRSKLQMAIDTALEQAEAARRARTFE